MSTKLLLQFNQSFHDDSGCDHTVATPGYFTFLTESLFETDVDAQYSIRWGKPIEFWLGQSWIPKSVSSE